MKSKTLKMLSFIIILTISTAFNIRNLSFNQFGFSSKLTNESSEIIQNPYCGFYHIYAYSLTDDDISAAVNFAERIKTNNPYSLALVEINLKNFNNRSISDAALEQLETILSTSEKSGKKLILRFMYDWDGRADETEPGTVEQILSHMDQIAPYVNSHKNGIYIMQGIFVGDYGEMHGTQYMSEDNFKTLLNHLDNCIDSSIFLAVRTPQHWRIANNILVSNLSGTINTTSLSSRLSLFNDGIAGSESDLGTYGTDSFENAQTPSDKGTRSEEIAFQNTLCSYVPNGGECVVDNPFNDFDNVITDFENMHVSYLNCDYDPDVMNKWKSTIYTSDDVFNGSTGYDYIEAHLGYRYVVCNSFLSANAASADTPGDTTGTTLAITIKNTGFAPSYKQFDSSLLVVNDKTGKRIVIPFEFDNRTLLNNTSQTINALLNPKELESGSYSVYYQMSVSTDSPNDSMKQLIRPANEGYNISDGGLFIGTLSIEK